MTIGTVKKIDEVTVSCRYCRAQTLMPVIAMNISARTACQRRYLDFTNDMPQSGKSSAPAMSACITKRSHTTMITGMLPTSHFALPSSSVKSM